MRTRLRLVVAASAVAALAFGCDQLQNEFLPGSPGEKLYRKHCAECHGVDGAGNTPRYMGNPDADLTDDSWQHGGGDPDSIAAVVHDGIFGKMPAHPELSPEEVRLIVDHVLKLRGETR